MYVNSNAMLQLAEALELLAKATIAVAEATEQLTKQ